MPLSVNSAGCTNLAANAADSDYTFMLEGHGIEETVSLSDQDLSANDSISSSGCLNIKADESKGWLGFSIPDVELQPGAEPKIKIYVQNVPGNGDVLACHLEATVAAVTEFA